MNEFLSSAGNGSLDVVYGEQQIKIAAIRLSEDPEYICDPGSVTQGDKCGQFMLIDFYLYSNSKKLLIIISFNKVHEI